MRLDDESESSNVEDRRGGGIGKAGGVGIGTVVIALIALGAVFVLAAAQALPPTGLVYQDATALANWAAPLIRRKRPDGYPPPVQSLAFLGVAIARLWGELLAVGRSGRCASALPGEPAAPGAGPCARGARVRRGHDHGRRCGRARR